MPVSTLCALVLAMLGMSAVSLFAAEPLLIPPQLSRSGGILAHPAAVWATNLNAEGAIFYSLDGTDPRTPVGTVSTNAWSYQGHPWPISIIRSTVVKARIRSGQRWSELVEASFMLSSDYSKLLITEVMYQPPGTNGFHERSREFAEIKNVGTETLDLTGFEFRGFYFPDGASIAPGGFKVLIYNTNAFQLDHPGVPIAGRYSQNMENTDDTIALYHVSGATIFSMSYGTHGPWPPSPDDHNFTDKGFSLVTRDPNRIPDPHDFHSWRPSTLEGGSPGADDPPDFRPQIQVTELLTRTGPSGYPYEAVELFNPHETNVNIGHWFLTDSRPQPKQFHIPPNTIVPARGHLILDERIYDSDPSNRVAFDSIGEAVYLYSANTARALTGYSAGFDYQGSDREVSYGRHINSHGDEFFVPQLSQTLGASNSRPRVGPIVITEIMYQPAGEDSDYLELMNISDQPVPLYDPQNPQHTWALAYAVPNYFNAYFFPSNLIIAPRSIFLAVNGDVAAFRDRHSVPVNVAIVPLVVRVDNFVEVGMVLSKVTGTATEPRYIPVDWVNPKRHWPWPVSADGSGSSLERLFPEQFGADPRNWRESPTILSAGRTNSGNIAPLVSLGSTLMVGVNHPVSLTAYVEDDGLPVVPGVVASRWSRLSGPGEMQWISTGFDTATAQFGSKGTNVLRITVDDGERTNTAEVIVIAQERPVLVSELENDQIRVRITATPGTRVLVESSENLKEWSYFTELPVPESGIATFAEPVSSSSTHQRFFRAKALP